MDVIADSNRSGEKEKRKLTRLIFGQSSEVLVVIVFCNDFCRCGIGHFDGMELTLSVRVLKGINGRASACFVVVAAAFT